MGAYVNNKSDSISGLKLLWQLTRPHTLTASFVPIFIGTALGMFYADIDIWLFIAMLLACLSLQIATNLFNEYYDFKRGLDTEESVGIGGAIVRHGMKPQTVLMMAVSLYGLAAIIGVYICMNSSWWLALIGVIGMAIGYLYTGGPLPIAYTPFGELFSGLSMGSAFILISFYIQTGILNGESVLISVPIGILVGAINLSNNIRDIEEDTLGGRRTLAILMGRTRAVYLLGGMFLLSYVWVIGLVVSGVVSPWLLLALLSFPKPVQALKAFFAGVQSPLQMILAMKATAQTNTVFGILLSVGLCISYIF
ncbi:MAG TPA: 1,4-dihydroxy-2-naphthoate polyprenyltransferase [Chondromyces sp.]|nr:1,4-dihydroxy-2-naphthoate polyprenyltransferase [Chondromyces sp.]